MGNSPSRDDSSDNGLDHVSQALETSIRQLGDGEASSPDRSGSGSLGSSFDTPTRDVAHDEDQGIDINGELLLSRVPRGKYAELKAAKELLDYGVISHQQYGSQRDTILHSIEPSKAFNSPFSTDRQRRVRLQQLLEFDSSVDAGKYSAFFDYIPTQYVPMTQS